MKKNKIVVMTKFTNLSIFTAILFFGGLAASCTVNINQSYTNENLNANAAISQNENEIVLDINENELVLDKNKEISIEESFIEKDSIKINGFEIKKIKVEKYDREFDEKAEIYDVVITKNGKQIAKFDGVFHSLRNEINFGLFSFFDKPNEQLIIVDTANRYEEDWIVDLSKDFKILFSSREYDIFRGYLARIDFDDDGVFEITLTKHDDIFGFPNASIPSNRIIFQYDKKLRKFLPASHKLQEFTLKNIAEQIQRFEADDKKQFSDVLEITLNYLYAGKEEEGWKFFDENFMPVDSLFIGKKFEDKEKAHEEIKNALNENPIYQFIKKDLEKSVAENKI